MLSSVILQAYLLTQTYFARTFSSYFAASETINIVRCGEERVFIAQPLASPFPFYFIISFNVWAILHMKNNLKLKLTKRESVNFLTRY